MAYKFTGRYEEAEDLTQDIFLKVYRSLESYDRGQEFFGWLVGITRNACIDHYRRHRREQIIVGEDVSNMSDIRCHGLSPHGSVEAAERSQMLRRCMNDLPEDLRSVLILRDLKGLSYREIVDQLKLNEGTVKSRIFRGRAELAGMIRGVVPDEGVTRKVSHGTGH